MAGFGLGFAGAAGALDPDDMFLYHCFDDASEKGESALGKTNSSRAFHEVVTLITGFFPHMKPSSSLDGHLWAFLKSRSVYLFGPLRQAGCVVEGGQREVQESRG